MKPTTRKKIIKPLKVIIIICSAVISSAFSVALVPTPAIVSAWLRAAAGAAAGSLVNQITVK